MQGRDKKINRKTTARKNKVDELIKMMSPKVAEASTSHVAGQDAGNDAS